MVDAFHYHFEWDPAKAAGNRRRHGVGFEQAATVFKDPLALSVFDEVKYSANMPMNGYFTPYTL